MTTINRRDLVLQLLRDTGQPTTEAVLLEQMRALHGIHLTPQSIRMILRGFGARAACVIQGPAGSAVWQFSPDGRAR